MLEDEEFTRCHFATRSGTIEFKHVFERQPQAYEIFFGEASDFVFMIRLSGRDVTFNAVESVRHDVFAAHLGSFLVFWAGYGNTCDGYFLLHDRV